MSPEPEIIRVSAMCCVKTRAEPGPAQGCEFVAHSGNGSASVSTHHNVETELLWALANTRRRSGVSPYQCYPILNCRCSRQRINIRNKPVKPLITIESNRKILMVWPKTNFSGPKNTLRCFDV